MNEKTKLKAWRGNLEQVYARGARSQGVIHRVNFRK